MRLRGPRVVDAGYRPDVYENGEWPWRWRREPCTRLPWMVGVLGLEPGPGMVSYADITVSIGGVKLEGLESITYSRGDGQARTVRAKSRT